MKKGFLSQYFVAVATKKLSAVESDKKRSHQHEFNGAKPLHNVLGPCGEKKVFPARFIWFGGENEGIVSDSNVTWYDSRINHPTRSECRLYFPGNEVMELAQEGDSMFIARRTDNSLIIIITSTHSTIENQLYWLFGIPRQTGFDFVFQDYKEDDKQLDFTARFILDELGIDIEEPESDRLDEILKIYNEKFPETREFSEFARSNYPEKINPVEDPDNALMEWMNFEEALFRRLERHLVSERLEKGFTDNDGADVTGFLSFSLSVQNRRKSRAGFALENHVETILWHNKIRFERNIYTEKRTSPDFLFPGGREYHDQNFPLSKLAMLGVKTSCKDRWRQILSEAAKINEKHLLTLEPAISSQQTDEMKRNRLQLIIPQILKSTYSNDQIKWLWNLKEFIDFVKNKQR